MSYSEDMLGYSINMGYEHFIFDSSLIFWLSFSDITQGHETPALNNQRMNQAMQ